MKCIALKYMRLSWPMKIHIHGFVNFSWFMKITGKEFHRNFMTQFSTMKSENRCFHGHEKGFMSFSTHFHGISIKKRFVVVSIHSPMWRWSLLKTGHCVWLEVASIFLSFAFEKTLQMAKKLVKMIRCRYVCYHIRGRKYSFYFFLGKTSRISASRFASS